VEILDHEEHGRGGSECIEEREQRLKGSGLRGLPSGGSGPEAGKHGVEAGPQRGRELIQDGVAVADEWAQSREQRCVREFTVAELHAVAPEHTDAGLPCEPREFVREARLTYAGITGYECQGRPALRSVAKRRLEFGQFA